ncbi:wax ester/triacylglycerol synthase domain-containing protein [Mycolicibacterium thermoresistibile]
MPRFMRASDAFTWAMESDARLRSTVVALIVLDGTPDWDDVRRRFDRISRTLPMFRQRVVETPPPAPPRWEFAADFDLDFHLRPVSAPAPGDLDAVLEMARVLAMEDFDRIRPMWRVLLVDGLADGGAAVLCAFHHALTDGVGAIQIGRILYEVSGRRPDRGPMPAEPEVPEPAPLSGYRDAVRYCVDVAGKAVTGALRSAPALIGRGIRQPLQTVSAAAATAASVYRTVRPVPAPGSELMTERSLLRRVGVHEVPLAPLRAAADRVGGTVNDAFIAGVAGGLRRYHEEHQVPVGELHMCMPISLRGPADEMGGNRITLMRFDVPVGIADPAVRIDRIRRRTTTVRTERSLPYTELIAAGLNLLPRWYIGAALRNVDFVASNVPGIPVRVYLGGAPVRFQCSFSPTIGAAVNVTMLTYAGSCALGINADSAAIPDFDVFHECLVAGFEEVLALAPERAEQPRPG